MTLPAQVSYATITGVFTSTGPPPSAGAAPAAVPLAGHITFTPDVVDGLVTVGSATPPIMLTINPEPVTLASDGSFTAQVVASGDTALNPAGWTYTVSFSLAGATIPNYTIGPLAPGATYDLATLLPVAAISGQSSVASVFGRTGVVLAATGDYTAAQVGADVAGAAAAVTTTSIGAIPLAQKGVASGVASLDGTGKLPAGQLPALAINTVYTVASQAAMLALSANPGDVAVRTDTSPSETFMLSAAPASTLANWVTIAIDAAPVTSVAGKTGVVTLAEADVANLTADLAAKVATTSVGAASGVASLDASTLVPVAQIPGIITTGTPTAGQVPTATSGTAAAWSTPAASSASSPLLARTQYAPTTLVTYSILTTKFSILDGTNLVATFVAPASGDVLVELSAFLNNTSSSAQAAWFAIGEIVAGTLASAIAGPSAQTAFLSNINTANYQGIHVTEHLVTGLTAGASYTFAFLAAASATGLQVLAGNPGGSTTAMPTAQAAPATMKVWAA